MEYIFSFSSRNSALRFADAVKGMGGRTKIINPPKMNGYGCGLAVKCDDYALCKNVLSCGYYAALKEIYTFDGSEYSCIYGCDTSA